MHKVKGEAMWHRDHEIVDKTTQNSQFADSGLFLIFLIVILIRRRDNFEKVLLIVDG